MFDTFETMTLLYVVAARCDLRQFYWRLFSNHS